MALTQADLNRMLGTRPTAQGIFDANQPTITNTPRSIVSGTWADILKPIVSNPVGEFVGAADMQRALDSVSYNQPLTTGNSVQTGGFRPEYLAAALGLTPVGKGKKVKTTFEVAQKTAQRNASLPIAEGGLGLPKNNTAMDRAKAMGFDDNWYHGRYSDYEQINPNKSFYVTQDPSYASIYSYEPTASSMGGKSIKDFQDLKPNVMPVMIRKNEILDTRIPAGKNIFDKDFYMKYGNATQLTEKNLPDWVEAEDFKDMFEATNSKLKGVFADEGKIPTWEGGLKDRGVSAAIFDPSIVRSRFAAFDPFRRNEADILAGVGIAIPTAGLLDENKKKKNK